MAGPKRVPFKNKQILTKQYRSEYWINFFIGVALSYPVAILVGNRAQRYQGGVPVVPYQRWVDDFPNVTPKRTTWRFFRRYALATSFILGSVFASRMTDNTAMNDDWHTRPDFKPFPAMVKEISDYDDNVYQQLLEKNYYKHNGKEWKKSPIYRFLNPNYADFTPKTNRFVGGDNFTNYNYATGAFPTTQHTYQDHMA